MGKPKKLTAEEWDACRYPGTMLPHLRTADARKLRLFVCACCRRVWDMLFDERSKRVVEAAEMWADGQMTARALKPIQLAACLAKKPKPFDRTILNRVNIPKPHDVGMRDYYAARAARSAGILQKTWVINTAWAATHATGDGADVVAEQEAQTHLIRDIFGNPFRPPVTFSPKWRTDTAVSLARTMYDSREFSAMPILADALQDAGCDDATILDHCRGTGPHVRGCWVVDLVLGKE
jgi:hypothetical protein